MSIEIGISVIIKRICKISNGTLSYLNRRGECRTEKLSGCI